MKAGASAFAAFAAFLTFVPAVSADDYVHEAQPGLIPPGGAFVLYYNSAGPLSYQMMTPKDVAGAELVGPVSSRSCQLRIAIPLVPPTVLTRGTSLTVAGGNGSYVKALRALQESHAGLRGIYDVSVDLHTVTVLGIFQRVCTEVAAKGFR